MTEHKCLVFSFANVKVREHEFCIVKDDEVLAVEPKAFRVLLFLLRSMRSGTIAPYLRTR
jgi:DNA-binding winged helix-turn-helix (wHTH) protein